jgi:uncharacterized protein (TIGR02186 family)
MRGAWIFGALAFMSASGLGGPPANAQGEHAIVADIDDHLVAISTDFAGQDILVFGAIQGGGDVVVVIRGPLSEVQVHRKERVAGLWVNAESMDFKDVPSLYGVASSRPLYEILSPETLDRYQLGVGRIKPTLIEGDPARERMFATELVRQKREKGLYADRVGRVIFVGPSLFRANLHLPSNVPTGTFLIDTFLVFEGKIVAAQNMPLVISKVGFGADVYRFANANAPAERAAYGLVAVLAAFALGWIAHLTFRRR